MLTIEFKTSNSAFEDYPLDESAAILETIAAKLRAGEHSGNVRDVNGNTIGFFEYSES